MIVPAAQKYRPLLIATAGVDILYGDEIDLSKPDWSPELLLAFPYTGRLCAFRKDAIARLGGWTAATLAAEPPDEPPATSGASEPLRRQGLTTTPKADVSFDEPMANSSLLSLPSMTAPALRMRSVTWLS